MDPFSSRKLVTGFLVLAVLGVSISLALSGFSLNAPAAPAADTYRASRASPANAFVESFDAARGDRSGPGESEAPDLPTTPVSVPNDLTERLARLIGEHIVAANPDGPRVRDGVLGAELPTMSSVVDRFATESDARAQAAALADAAERPLARIALLDDYAEEDIVRYAERLNAALADNLLDPSFVAIAESAPTPDGANAIDVTLARAEREVAVLRVPAPFRDLHASALRAVSELRALRALITNDGDPLANAIAFGIRSDRADAALAAFNREAVDLYIWSLSLPRDASRANARPNGALSWLGIRAAEASVVSTPIECIGVVCATVAAALGVTAAGTGKVLDQNVKEFLKRFALEYFKDVLVHRLVLQTIQWIQGSGKPQFITDWKGFLGQAANEAIGGALSGLVPQLCLSFGPLIEVAVLPVNTAADRPVLCTLTQVIGNVRAFADDFANGGWVAYGAALEPQNNFFGALIQTSDILNREARVGAGAARGDAEASQGWLSTRVCAKYVQGVTGYMRGMPIQGRTCAEWITTTPGAALGYNVYDALGSPIHRIVNAQDVAALTSALLNFAITKLVNLARSSSGAYTSINPGLAGLNPAATSTAPDFSRCYTISDAPKRQQCIDDICRFSGWNQPPCNQPPGPPPGPPGVPRCPDGICTPGNENCSSCPQDCGGCSGPPGSYCGDEWCDVATENKTTCPQDCPYCGDGQCWMDRDLGQETCSNCAVDCGPCNLPGACCSGSPYTCSITTQASCGSAYFWEGASCGANTCSCGAIGGTECISNTSPPGTTCASLGRTSLGPTTECQVDCCR